MATRTTCRTVTFTKPFVLGDFDEVLPAGDYIVETDEELIQGISYPAYLRVLNLVHIHHVSSRPGVTRTVIIAPHELEAALARDRDRSGPSSSADDDLKVQAQANKAPTSSVGRAANEEGENEGMQHHAQKGD